MFASPSITSSFRSPPWRVLACLACLAVPTFFADQAFAASRAQLRNICRVKGQEENVLKGIGLIVGLSGTGESGDAQTMRHLAQAMESLGSRVSLTGRLDEEALEDLKKVKNVSVAWVTATVPATGARRGDQLDCFVAGINGKSLVGGRLAYAALTGPNSQDRQIYALCQGQLTVDDPDQPMVARVSNGCQMEQDVFTPFVKDGMITLVIDRNHADFAVASAIAERINYDYGDQFSRQGEQQAQGQQPQTRQVLLQDEEAGKLARAVNAANVVVRVPQHYSTYPVAFVAEILEMTIDIVEPEARVVVNPRSGSIVISGDVEIGAVVITHRNLVIEAVGTAEFARVDPGQFNSTKLDRLLEALTALKVPADDVIEIIRGIDRNGKLHAKLIVE
ncbi:Flagellar P-ring protein precursor [Pirellulimonas nuda]|uniref:Flagellar P-ring protein n=1 Tax=Pirellulimonas nuda TaxID=2528009 RepID=A0A518DFS9_9BACT|nr:flagellar basal body P-ring protein FlgI [Pirellulimonas nuda]QDU90318.1 Flagellar P-ring protein precursor [Pirellulimonas nuda]